MRWALSTVYENGSARPTPPSFSRAARTGQRSASNAAGPARCCSGVPHHRSAERRSTTTHCSRRRRPRGSSDCHSGHAAKGAGAACVYSLQSCGRSAISSPCRSTRTVVSAVAISARMLTPPAQSVKGPSARTSRHPLRCSQRNRLGQSGDCPLRRGHPGRHADGTGLPGYGRGVEEV
jgi:hypothetical protein